MDSDLFTRRVRAYRKLKQLTQQELAAALGVSVAIIGGMERGTRMPSDSLIQKLITVLDVSRTELGLEGMVTSRQEHGGE